MGIKCVEAKLWSLKRVRGVLDSLCCVVIFNTFEKPYELLLLLGFDFNTFSLRLCLSVCQSLVEVTLSGL